MLKHKLVCKNGSLIKLLHLLFVQEHSDRFREEVLEVLQEKLWWITGGLNDICYQSPLRGDNVEGVTTYKCQHRCTLERAEPAVLAKEAVVLQCLQGPQDV